jgi:hypothetical protein
MASLMAESAAEDNIALKILKQLETQPMFKIKSKTNLSLQTNINHLIHLEYQTELATIVLLITEKVWYNNIIIHIYLKLLLR